MVQILAVLEGQLEEGTNLSLHAFETFFETHGFEFCLAPWDGPHSFETPQTTHHLKVGSKGLVSLVPVDLQQRISPLGCKLHQVGEL